MSDRVKQPGAPIGKLYYELVQTAGSDITLDIRAEIGRTAVRTSIVNDSANSAHIEVSHNGVDYSDLVLLKTQESMVLDPLVVSHLRFSEIAGAITCRVVAY